VPGTRFQCYQRAKQYLRGHPDASDEDVAAFAGLKLAFPEEAETLKAARSDFEDERGPGTE